jgi:FlaG/FlaF family flagellin (archaellin)
MPLDDDAISPVIGIVLMLAVTVILSGIVGLFVIDNTTDIESAPQAEVVFFEQPDGTIAVESTTIETADELQILVNGTQQATLTRVGQTQTVSPGSITVVAVRDGSRRVTQTFQNRATNASTTTSTVSGTITINPSIENASVTAVDPSGSVIDNATTDVNGQYELAGDGLEKATLIISVEGFNSGATAHPLYTSATVPANTSTSVNVDFDETSAFNATVNNSPVSIIHRGEGSLAAPYKIGNVHQLQAINESDTKREKQYELLADVDAGQTSNWNGGNGFRPIGVKGGSFNGTFDGQGHTVSNLFIGKSVNTGTDTGGTFGIVGPDGVVTSVHISNAEVATNNGFNVGILAGINNGKLKNSTTSGAIFGVSTVGGLVGSNDNGAVSNSSSTATVKAGGINHGGLIGANRANGVVKNSYARGTVDGDENVGGLAGANSGTVDASYSAAQIQDGTNIGGFSGDSTGTASRSYWDTNESGVSSSAGNETALNTSEMQGTTAETSMSGLDFVGNWTTVPGDYPELQD